MFSQSIKNAKVRLKVSSILLSYSLKICFYLSLLSVPLKKTRGIFVEDNNWLCDVDWSQTFTVSEDGDIVQRRDFDSSKLWDTGALGDGKDDKICGYISENCPKSTKKQLQNCHSCSRLCLDIRD